jgi:hypothetical protein
MSRRGFKSWAERHRRKGDGQFPVHDASARSLRSDSRMGRSLMDAKRRCIKPFEAFRVPRIRQRDALRVARIPCVFGELYFLLRCSPREWRQWGHRFHRVTPAIRNQPTRRDGRGDWTKVLVDDIARPGCLVGSARRRTVIWNRAVASNDTIVQWQTPGASVVIKINQSRGELQ